MASLFCALPLNWTRVPTDAMSDTLAGSPLNMIDGDTDTYWEADTATGGIRLPLGDSSLSFDAYYLVCENVGGYTASGLTAQTAPLSLSRDTAASDTKQFAFHQFTEQSGTAVNWNWTSRISDSAPIRIYEFWVLKQLFNVSPEEGFRQITQTRSFRGAEVQEALDGTRTRTLPLGVKWRVDYIMNILTDVDEKVDALNTMFLENPNFVHVVDWPRHPDRIYRAYLTGEGIVHAYISEFTGAGSTARFGIEQQ